MGAINNQEGLTSILNSFLLPVSPSQSQSVALLPTGPKYSDSALHSAWNLLPPPLANSLPALFKSCPCPHCHCRGSGLHFSSDSLYNNLKPVLLPHHLPSVHHSYCCKVLFSKTNLATLILGLESFGSPLLQSRASH